MINMNCSKVYGSVFLPDFLTGVTISDIQRDWAALLHCSHTSHISLL